MKDNYASFGKNNTIVVVPTYNEIENITNIVQTVLWLNRPFDILIVDNNSLTAVVRWLTNWL